MAAFLLEIRFFISAPRGAITIAQEGMFLMRILLRLDINPSSLNIVFWAGTTHFGCS